MSNIRYYAPTGTTEITLSSGTKLAVNSSGYVTADASFAPELQRAGFTAGTEDSVQAVTGPNGLFTLLVNGADYALTAVPKTNDSAGLNAAIASVYALGGGTVKLLPVTYTLTGPVYLKPGVSLIGELWVNTVSGSVPEAGSLLYSGSILVGDGTFIGVACNAEDQASSTTALTASGSTLARSANAFSSNTLNGAEIGRFAVKNCTYGIKLGGQNNSSLLQGYVHDIYAENCTVWGMSFDNFQVSQFNNLYAFVGIDNANGIRFAGSVANGDSILIPGDSGINGAHAFCHYRNNRGILFEADDNGITGTKLNDMHGMRLLANKTNGIGADLGTQAAVSNATTISSGVADIPVTNLEYFPVGMPVWFRASGATDYRNVAGILAVGTYGLNAGLPNAATQANQIYFIKSRSGTSGAGTVQISNSYGAAAFSPTGSGAATIWTGGFAGIECKAPGGGSTINSTELTFSSEAINSPAFISNNMTGGSVKINDILATSIVGAVLRGAGSMLVANTTSAVPLSTDFDSASSTVRLDGYIASPADGASYIQPVGFGGVGFKSGRLVTYLTGNPNLANGTNVTASVLFLGDNSFMMQLVVTGAGATGLVCTATPSRALTEPYNKFIACLSPGNAAAAALTGANQLRVDTASKSPTTISFYCDGTMAAGTYTYNVRF